MTLATHLRLDGDDAPRRRRLLPTLTVGAGHSQVLLRQLLRRVQNDVQKFCLRRRNIARREPPAVSHIMFAYAVLRS